MAEKRRHNTEEVTREGIRLVPEPGDGVSETAHHLGINAQMWGRWTCARDTQASAVLPDHGRMASDQAAVRR
jgi:transposase-like protein